VSGEKHHPNSESKQGNARKRAMASQEDMGLAQDKRQPARRGKKCRELQPLNLPRGKRINQARSECGDGMEPQMATKQKREPTRERQMQNRAPMKGASNRQKVEQQIAGIQNGGLAVGDKRRAAKLIRVPERNSAIVNGLRRKQSPGIKLRDAVPAEASALNGATCFSKSAGRNTSPPTAERQRNTFASRK
jgi:anti-sigma28 factor (negative regulator of flagellin synthesis)